MLKGHADNCALQFASVKCSCGAMERMERMERIVLAVEVWERVCTIRENACCDDEFWKSETTRLLATVRNEQESKNG